MMPTAEQLKQDGNRHFQAGDFIGAEALYSKAIVADPKEPTLYTNRAMARLRLKLWDQVIADCNDCLTYSPENFKAYYYLAQAHLERHDFDDALQHALRAHQLCNDKSLESVTSLVLKVRKLRWEDREKKRKREGTALEDEVLGMMEREKEAALREMAVEQMAGEGEGQEVDEGARREIEAEWDAKIESMRKVFEKARAESEKKRVVPTWAVDEIMFGYMVDPVVTKSGKSYERSSIMEHIRRHHTDPVTRERLSIEDIRPNLNLKQACEEFLEENGWAVDW